MRYCMHKMTMFLYFPKNVPIFPKRVPIFPKHVPIFPLSVNGAQGMHTMCSFGALTHSKCFVRSIIKPENIHVRCKHYEHKAHFKKEPARPELASISELDVSEVARSEPPLARRARENNRYSGDRALAEASAEVAEAGAIATFKAQQPLTVHLRTILRSGSQSLQDP